MRLRPLLNRRRVSSGSPPGELASPQVEVTPTLHLLAWSGDDLEDRSIPTSAAGELREEGGRVTWIDVQGLGDGGVVTALGHSFSLHPLAVADVVNVGQRPKVERYEQTLFVVLRMVTLQEGRFAYEQLSLFLCGQTVLTFQERPGDCLDPLRQRIRAGTKRLRANGGGYLAVMVMDAIVDGYFPVLEAFGEELELLEQAVLADPTTTVLERVYSAKRDLLAFRRAVWPLREALSALLRDETLPEETHPYLRDVSDHLSQVADILETYRELAGSFVDVYLSSISQRTNESMRVLTVIATIFIPLTFVAGIYGMNFDTAQPGNMPELGWPYAYAGFWAICAVITVGLLLLFRRLGWLGGRG